MAATPPLRTYAQLTAADPGGAAAGRAALALSATFRNQGWSVISTAAGNSSGTGKLITPAAAYGQPGFNIRGLTYQQHEVSPVSVPQVRLVHANWANTGTTAGAVTSEMTPYGDVYLSASAVDLTNAAFFVASYNGERHKRLSSFGIAVSDPTSCPVVAGTPYGVRTCLMGSGFDQAIPVATNNQGATTGGAILFPLAGYFADDFTFSTVTTGYLTSGTSVPCHQVILGYTGNSPSKSAALLLDSIMQGLGDVFGPGLSGGWGMRFAQQQFNFNVTAANTGTPLCGATNLSKQGDTLENFLQGRQHAGRLALIALHTNCIDQGGINTLIAGGAAATVQASILATASLITGLGVKYIRATLTPVSSTTDGWQTAANQTAGYLPARTTINNWLRDSSSAGFVKQAIAAGCPASLLAVYDPCAVVEVNASNALTLNGGLWLAPTAAALYTGSVTTGGGSSGFTDSALPATANLYRGGAACITSGTNSGASAVAGISAMTAAGVLSFNRGYGSNFVAGNTYKIYGAGGITTQDGTHISTYGNILIAQDFPASLLI
jgi:hypothetical protein